MLTDRIVEEEFEIKEEEPWYDKQDLEHGTVPPQSLCLEPLKKKRTTWVLLSNCLVTFNL